jgi:hypothetical protein
MALPLPLGQLARIAAATALMGAALMAQPGDHANLVQSVLLGVVAYGFGAIAFDVMGARTFIFDALCAIGRRMKPNVPSPSDV